MVILLHMAIIDSPCRSLSHDWEASGKVSTLDEHVADDRERNHSNFKPHM